jgi:ribonuclease P protein subunit POP4
MMAKKETLAQEFIGKEILIIDSKTASLKGLQGMVVDETKNLLMLSTPIGTKKIQKNQITFTIDKKEIIDGKDIIKNPEERIKSRIKNE